MVAPLDELLPSINVIASGLIDRATVNTLAKRLNELRMLSVFLEYHPQESTFGE